MPDKVDILRQAVRNALREEVRFILQVLRRTPWEFGERNLGFVPRLNWGKGPPCPIGDTGILEILPYRKGLQGQRCRQQNCHKS